MRRTFFLLIVFVLAVNSTSAQPPRRDESAIRLLAAAHAALGAPPSLERVQSVVTRGQIEPADTSRAAASFVGRLRGTKFDGRLCPVATPASSSPGTEALRTLETEAQSNCPGMWLWRSLRFTCPAHSSPSS